MTQLCHDVAHYEWWVEKIRAHITLPIDVGIMPVLAKDPTIRMAVSTAAPFQETWLKLLPAWR